MTVTTTATHLPLSATAEARGQQQRAGRPRRPIPSRS